ncbi:terminase family protein [Inquilinus sp.]|uniref:terminase large subunit domain-containing protein n=1 Tax=Inquilinus sp. TaxID=1932117 RepID=UPI0031DA61A9
MASRVRRIVIPYSPRHVFCPYHERKERFAVVVAHRRCGKTVATINDMIRRAILDRTGDARFAYIAPLFVQAKDVAWHYLKRFSQPLLATPPNESELRVDLINGSRIRLYGADNPDRMRGLALSGVVLDEYADMHPGVWGEVIRPALADRQGWATFIGTPKGRNSFWEMYDRAGREPGWMQLMMRASETGLLPPEELAAAAKDMTPEQVAQEFECSFEAAILGAYYGKGIAEAERQGRITDVPYDPDLPVHTAWDLGRRDSTAIWFFQVAANQIRWIDFYENSGEDLEHYVMVLRSKPYRYGTDWMPHDAKVKVLGMKKTRVETLVELKRNPRLVPDHKVMDGINAGRLTLERSWFDKTNCALGLEALRQYRTEYDEKKRAFRDTPRHDWTSHCADAFRYGAMAWRAVDPPAAPPPPPPLRGIREMTFDEALKRVQRPKRTRI